MAEKSSTPPARDPVAALNLDNLNASVSTPSRKFQCMILALLCLNYFPLVFNHVIMAFYGGVPRHVCQLSATESDGSFAKYNNMTVLKEAAGQCQTTIYLENGANSTVRCESGQWTYEPEFGETTIVSEFDLVCEDKSLGSYATTIYFCGVMVGGLFFGYVSDTIGRLPVLLLTLYLPIAIGVGIAFTQTYVQFVILRFIQGVIIQGLQNATYVLAMEFFVPKSRPLVASALESCWGLSVMALAGLAYFIKNWRYLQLAISLPSVLAVFYICVVPESLRWLVMKGRMSRAEKLLTRIAKFNHIDFPAQGWESIKKAADQTVAKTRYNFIHLFKTPRLRKRSLISFYMWLVISTCYYGLTFMITSLPGNKYLNFFIGGTVEFVAYFSSFFVMHKFGFKKPMILCFVASGVCCIIAASVPAAPKTSGVNIGGVSTAFAVIGRFFIAGLFAIIFVYTTTLYPTVIRITGFGTCVFWARVGGVIAPQINRLGVGMAVVVPILVFGALTLSGGILMVWMPCTHHRKMPDTIDDVERRDDDVKLPVPAYEKEVELESESGPISEKYNTRL